jgi:hypothetical protein
VPPHEPQLVAQGFFAPNSPWAVRVSRTVGYGDAADPGFVDDATVEVWEGEQRLARLARRDTGTYVGVDPLPVPGKTYTLRVSAPGYGSTEGTDALPGPVPVSAFREHVIELDDTTRITRRILQVDLTLDDPTGIANYYGLLVFQVRWQEDIRTGQIRWLPPSLFGFESDDPVLGESPLAFLNTDKTYYIEAFFPDTDFDGERRTLTFDVQYDASRPDAAVITHRAFAVVFLSLSHAFYHYWKTAEQQALAGPNPFAEPVRVYSNLSGEFGVFAGFQVRFFPLGGTSSEVLQTGINQLCHLAGPGLPFCSAIPGWPVAGSANVSADPLSSRPPYGLSRLHGSYP